MTCLDNGKMAIEMRRKWTMTETIKDIIWRSTRTLYYLKNLHPSYLAFLPSPSFPDKDLTTEVTYNANS